MNIYIKVPISNAQPATTGEFLMRLAVRPSRPSDSGWDVEVQFADLTATLRSRDLGCLSSLKQYIRETAINPAYVDPMLPDGRRRHHSGPDLMISSPLETSARVHKCGQCHDHLLVWLYFDSGQSENAISTSDSFEWAALRNAPFTALNEIIDNALLDLSSEVSHELEYRRTVEFQFHEFVETSLCSDDERPEFPWEFSAQINTGNVRLRARDRRFIRRALMFFKSADSARERSSSRKRTLDLSRHFRVPVKVSERDDKQGYELRIGTPDKAMIVWTGLVEPTLTAVRNSLEELYPYGAEGLRRSGP